MTLMKSLLLGTAAGLVVVAGAQAADLPTKKGAPAAEYVKVCSITVNGTPIVGFTLPGSDTCLKISGYVSAQYTVGNTKIATQDAVGLFTRGQVNFDAASNTAMGALLAHVELQSDYGAGFDSQYGPTGNPTTRTRINNAYIQWAGLTVGKHASFYDFIGGSINTWDDILSPDHTGGPVNLAAYTASFGGGFSATLSLEQPEDAEPTSIVATGVRSPDIVGQLALSQAWGGAQLSAVFHNVNYTATAGTNPGEDLWGYGILGGLKFNIPGMAGADVKVQGAYAKDAVGYSGINSGFGAVNTVAAVGATAITDVVFPTATTLGHSTSWTVAGGADFPVSSTFKISPEASYGAVSYSNGSKLAESGFVGGGTLEWTPVKNLVFDLDLLYVTGSYTAPTGVKTNFDGFNGKLRIERDF